MCASIERPAGVFSKRSNFTGNTFFFLRIRCRRFYTPLADPSTSIVRARCCDMVIPTTRPHCHTVAVAAGFGDQSVKGEAVVLGSGTDYLLVVPDFGGPRCMQACPIQF